MTTKGSFASQGNDQKVVTGYLMAIKRIKWGNFLILIILPVYAILQIPWVPLHPSTLIWSVIYLVLSMCSITAGTCMYITQWVWNRSQNFHKETLAH